MELKIVKTMHLRDGAMLGTSLVCSKDVDLHWVILVDIDEVAFTELLSKLLAYFVMAFCAFFSQMLGSDLETRTIDKAFKKFTWSPFSVPGNLYRELQRILYAIFKNTVGGTSSQETGQAKASGFHLSKRLKLNKRVHQNI